MLTKEDIRNLLARRFCNDIHKKLSEIPTPSALKDIYKGANRIKEAIERNEHIAIVGDYDVDGVVSSVILAEFFDDLGVKNYLVKIPNRFKDGYGLNPEIIDELASDVSLIITVDNGISANEAASICNVANNGKVMANKDVCQTVILLKLFKQVDYLGLNRNVQRRNRLVADNNFWLKHNSASNTNTLALTARELVRVAVLELKVKANFLHYLFNASITL